MARHVHVHLHDESTSRDALPDRDRDARNMIAKHERAAAKHRSLAVKDPKHRDAMERHQNAARSFQQVFSTPGKRDKESPYTAAFSLGHRADMLSRSLGVEPG